MKMPHDLSEGAIEDIVNAATCDSPVLQMISSKKIGGGQGADRYRLLVSDGLHSYSHAMLATQLNEMIDDGAMDPLCVIKVNQYICNTLQGNRRVMIFLDVDVLAKGSDVGARIGNPQPFKAAQPVDPASASGGAPQSATVQESSNRAAPTQAVSPPANKPAYNIKGGSGPGTPGGTRIHSIASLTPYQNRWRIRARVTQKSDIRTWSNSRGEGRLFSVNLIDESGEIRATGFTDVVDKYYNMLEVNKVYYITKATLKTANKQYSSLNNDYEMTFNSDSLIEPCEEKTDLPTMSFDFVKIDALEDKQPQAMIDVIGIVKNVGDVTTIVGKQSKKEVSKREVQLVDQTGMGVNMTLWGNTAETFKGDDNPVIACKGCRVSDWGGRSLSLLSSSQMIMNPDIRDAFLLKGWWEKEGSNQDFQAYSRSEGMGGSSTTNWKTLMQVKTENLGHGDKPDYFTAKGTVIFLRKENCMYMACPTEQCNKKLIDQGNGQYRCEKCNKEFPNYKWRMILSVNLADHTDNQWATCFQDSAEIILKTTADDLGNMKESNEVAFDQIFTEANFKSYTFKLRAKMETYNDESRLKTVCVSATPLDWVTEGKRLVDEINKLVI